MITLKNITKKYSKQTVLDIIALDIPVGQTFGLVGNNGAGKTTMFSCLLDLIKPTTGNVLNNGVEVASSEKWKSFTSAFLDDTFLIGYLPYGIAIIVMTILVRLLMSPVTYKSYLSQAKMKVLKPEITEINDKFKDNAMKKQQETMKIYNKAGVNPMSGCVPALVQMPIFYALFMFFPTSFALRQKSFLWADDLSSYDTILELPFYIPFYGDHVSLFPILASVAIFFYMMMTTGQNMPTQPGMPNMKFIIYLSPVMMLIFFNSYASGLSLYYFVSNLITIFIMLAIKNFILDDDKIHARIQANKEKPKKEGKFQAKMREIMEQAEAKKNQR